MYTTASPKLSKSNIYEGNVCWKKTNFVSPAHASYLPGVLDEQKALRQDMEENPTSQVIAVINDNDLDNYNALKDVDNNISAE